MAEQPPPTPGEPPSSEANKQHCFICYLDEGEEGASVSEWVSPCPCSLQAHQDCMLDWVTNLEREKKELKCPVCKAPIYVDGPWDPVLALNDQVKRAFGRVSPGIFVTGLSLGTAIGMSSYGLLAIRIFAGERSFEDYIYRWDHGRLRHNVWTFLGAGTIAPALTMSQSFPILANMFFLPLASLVSILPTSSSLSELYS
jgi:hypothetical protein